jgi:hypothetical protein
MLKVHSTEFIDTSNAVENLLWLNQHIVSIFNDISLMFQPTKNSFVQSNYQTSKAKAIHWKMDMWFVCTSSFLEKSFVTFHLAPTFSIVPESIWEN